MSDQKLHVKMPGIPNRAECDCAKRAKEHKRLKCAGGCGHPCPKCKGAGVVDRPLAICGAFEVGARFDGHGVGCKKCKARLDANVQLFNQCHKEARARGEELPSFFAGEQRAFVPATPPPPQGDATDEQPSEFSGSIQ